ncbi:2'-5' RNA ligase family protein [Rhizobium rhizophilum]|uniref:2'-5' RNA ligase family protein n=1 Tax=Rhizobium rhizophilum TaxID=1850373 RepID=A0ABY2QRH9_9HYPH|nr:2'-5' RNA ligase family protein [Rhizobium rhizophilum]THV12460.1 2'-5' RNA ligase family protein [Rhizobium rhizophilum]
MKTLQPLILTARMSDRDLKPFDRLRQEHFPPDRNFLAAHLTMFHRLPGEYREKVVEHLIEVATGYAPITADVSGLRHLGAGVAFTIASPDLQDIHAGLRRAFMPWLGGQDMQKWQPHITVQNKVSKLAAATLHAELMEGFRPHTIEIIGLDLWRYLGGPWQHESFAMFGQAR